MDYQRFFKIRKTLNVGICCLGLLMLSGCHVNGHYSGDGESSRYSEAVDSRQHITRENAKEAMALYERLYARNSGEQKIAVKYAEALRKAGHPKQAVTILSPLASRKINVDTEVLLEYATVNIELGHFLHASHAIERIIESKNPKNKIYLPEAHNLRGVVLSASGKYEEAEISYREALSSWIGDPSLVMNNLALSLAEQGHFDKSIEMLRQASGLSTESKTFEKNIEFVEALRNTVISAPQ